MHFTTQIINIRYHKNLFLYFLSILTFACADDFDDTLYIPDPDGEIQTNTTSPPLTGGGECTTLAASDTIYSSIRTIEFSVNNVSARSANNNLYINDTNGDSELLLSSNNVAFNYDVRLTSLGYNYIVFSNETIGATKVLININGSEYTATPICHPGRTCFGVNIYVDPN